MLLKNLKDHASNLEDTILKDVEKKVEEKKIGELVNKCANVHTQLLKNIRFFKKSVNHIVEVYKFCHQWLKSTKEIKNQIHTLETQILQLSDVVDLKKDGDGNGRLQIENLYIKLNLLIDQKEKIRKDFGHLRDVVDIHLSNMVNILEDS